MSPQQTLNKATRVTLSLRPPPPPHLIYDDVFIAHFNKIYCQKYSAQISEFKDDADTRFPHVQGTDLEREILASDFQILID